MEEQIYAEPIPNTLEDFFNNKIILEALKKFIRKNTINDKAVKYIDDFFEHKKNLEGYTTFEKKSFYKSLAKSLNDNKNPDSSALDLLIGLLEDKKPRNESNFKELYNMLEFGVYPMANQGNQGNSVYATFGNPEKPTPESTYNSQEHYRSRMIEQKPMPATAAYVYEEPVSVSLANKGFDYRNVVGAKNQEYIPVGSQPPVNESLYGSINGNAESVSPSVLAQDPEMVGPDIYAGFWGVKDLEGRNY